MRTVLLLLLAFATFSLVSPLPQRWRVGLLITVTALDGAGNSTAASLDVTYTPPVGGGLVAAYGFDDGAGATVTDHSGNSNMGTIDGATWTAGLYGGALSFDGVDDRVLVDASSSLDLGSAMTLEAWVQPAATQSSWRTVIQRGISEYFLSSGNTWSRP